jgi:PKD repeat protein/surface antigen
MKKIALIFFCLVFIWVELGMAVENCCGLNSPGNDFSCGPHSAGYGNCTWYARYMRPEVEGICTTNAVNWYNQAQNGGLPVGQIPAIGSIAVFNYWMTLDGVYQNVGHVAYVESINQNGSFNVSEMGWRAWNCMHTSTYDSNSLDGLIGFIFPNGALKFSDSPTVYYYSNNQYWPILDEETYSMLGFTTNQCYNSPDWSYVTEVNASQRPNYNLRNWLIPSNGVVIRIADKIGPKTCSMRDVGRNAAAVYLFDGTNFRLIASEQVYLDLGYAWSDVVEITQDLFNLHGEGETIYDASVYIAGSGGGNNYTFNNSVTTDYVNPNSPYNPNPEKTVFYNDDLYAYSWVQLDNVYESLNIKWRWYNSFGFASEYEFITDDPGAGYFPWYKVWSSVYLGNSDKYGAWHVNVYVDDVKVATDFFTFVVDPSTVLTLVATAISKSQIELTWSAVANADSYYIYRFGTLFGSTTGTLYYNTALSSNTEYCYQVVAYIGYAASFSNQVCATTFPEAPIANFTANATTGIAPLTVQFTDTTVGYVSSWSWDFGDGTYSTAQNPTHTYSSGGEYEVKLTVSNYGGSDTEIKQNFITAYSCFPAVRIAGATPVYFSSIQAAYNVAVDGDIIQSRATVIEEYLNFNRDISITLEGGYDCGYEAMVGNSLLAGLLVIEDGEVVIENFRIFEYD